MALLDSVRRRLNSVPTVITSSFKPIQRNSTFDVMFEKGLVTGGTPSWDDAEGEKTIEHPDTAFELYQQIYQKVPVAKMAIDHTANFAIQSGYELEGPAVHVETLKKWIDKVNFDLLLLDAMKQMQIYGNAYLEISDIQNPKFLPTSQMYVVVAKGGGADGQLRGYKQKTNLGEPIGFDTEEIVHFRWNVESGLPQSGFYGISDLKSTTATLKRLLNFQDDMGEVVHRHAEPIIHWILGTEDSPATAAQDEEFKNTLADREKGGDLITSFGVEGKIIGTDLHMVQPEGIIEHYENQLIAAFQVPEFFIRGGRTANRAIADIELQAFDRKIKAIRSIVSMYVEDFIFPKIIDNQKVQIIWNEPSFQTEVQKAEMLSNLCAAKGARLPIEVGLRMSGWGGYVNDVQAAGGQTDMGPAPTEEPKEENYLTQADWAKDYVRWKKSIAINSGEDEKP